MSNHNAAHTKLVQEIRLALGSGALPVVVWPAPNGRAVEWSERTARVTQHHLGLPPGTGDLVGILRLDVHLGVWIEIEAKTGTGRPSEAQVTRASLVRKFGGRYGVARSASEAVDLVSSWLAELTRGQ